MFDPISKTFTLPVVVEFEDVDSFRIVHNSRIIDYFERARVRFLVQTIGIDLYPEKAKIVVYRLEVRFNKPAFLLDDLLSSVVIRSADRYRLDLGYKLMRGSEVLARGGSGIAFMDAINGTLLPIPPKYLQQVQPFIRNVHLKTRDDTITQGIILP